MKQLKQATTEGSVTSGKGTETDLVKLPRISQDVLFQNAFAHAAIGMALVATDGRWLCVNQSLCTLTGYNEDELLQRRFQDITHPDDVATDLENARQLLEGGISLYQREKRYIHRDGSTIWVLLSVSLARDEHGEPEFFISQMQDISARKAGEQQLHAAAAEIERLRQGMIKICTWTKRIEVDGQWLTVDDFLSRYLHLNLTQTMSDEAVRLFGNHQAPP